MRVGACRKAGWETRYAPHAGSSYVLALPLNVRCSDGSCWLGNGLPGRAVLPEAAGFLCEAYLCSIAVCATQWTPVCRVFAVDALRSADQCAPWGANGVGAPFLCAIPQHNLRVRLDRLRQHRSLCVRGTWDTYLRQRYDCGRIERPLPQAPIPQVAPGHAVDVRLLIPPFHLRQR
jgi:hypothetical protein